jgi:glycosyltransferase involved in cell wall biosynthesis
MRILMVAERMPPSLGGVEKHIEGILGILRSRGHDFALVAPAASETPSSPQTFEDRPVMHIPVRTKTALKYMEAWQWWIRHRGLIDAADVLHFHDVYALLHWFGPLLQLFPGKPRFVTFHGYEMEYPVPKRARFYRALGDRLACRSIAVGHYLPKWFDVRPSSITYGGVHLPEQVFPSPREHRALFVGRLAGDTGIHIYVEGLRILRDEHGISLPLLVCGDGPERDSAQHRARVLGLPVTFLGFHPSPGSLYRECSIALVSGYLAMLEAMAHQRPVFSVFHSPVKEDYLRMFPKSDLLFTISSSPGELAMLLKSFIVGDLLLERQIDDAFRFAGTCSWERLADAYETLWTSIV